MNRVPIPPATTVEKSHLTKLAERAAMLAEAGNTDGVQQTEREIDEIVYRLFDLTPDEIAHIEKSLVNTVREESDNEHMGDDE